MGALADVIVAYVAEQTRLRGRGPYNEWSMSVDSIARALDLDDGAAQTAIRKAWLDERLHVEVIRGDDLVHSVMLGERR